MSQDKNPPGSAADWLVRAKGDLVLAEIPLPAGAFYEDLCFSHPTGSGEGLEGRIPTQGTNISIHTRP